MATAKECRSAIETLSERLASSDDVRRQVQERTMSCRLTDLDLVFRGRLTEDGLVDITDAITADPAQIRLTMSSNDLVDLVDGRLGFPSAWASGRVKVEASIRDLIRLRSLMG